MILEKITYITGVTGLISIFIVAAISGHGFLWIIGILVILLLLYVRVGLKEIDREVDFLFIFILFIVWLISIFVFMD